MTDVDGKQVWKVWPTSSTIHYTGSCQGQGNFIVKVLDGNQDLEELVCNEIGEWTIDKSVAVTPGKMYYVQIECSRGTWNMQWTGTGGAQEA